MAETGYGGQPYGGGESSYTGLPWDYSYGVTQSTWMSWNTHTQQAWLQELNRTPEQQNYSEQEKPWYWDEAQQYEDYKDGDSTINPLEPIFDPIVNTTKNIAIAAVAILLLSVTR